ncbi:hypothetical protein GCM10023185_06890 [Hymenobacter saemangeumensis]|uniref:Uncharacterized protein n=1 Tax=Hymenobacter saemangeumensis TaxID=1084522 RepID=A0ABP8I283_9BACT
MKALLTVLLFLACAGCSLLRPNPERQLGRLLTKFPELNTRDTVTVHDTVTVEQVKVETRYVAMPNPVRERRDSLHLDSLLAKLSASLDSAQRKAAQGSIHRLVRQRPYFPDTLCFDTLGVHGRIWQRGNVYHIKLTRDAITTPVAAKTVVTRIKPCNCNPVFGWRQPATWPRWVYLVLGAVARSLLTVSLIRLARQV